MIRATPNTNISLPRGYESSSLRPQRDSDSPQRVWQKNNRSTAQVESLAIAVDNLSKQVGRVRRRILGGQPSQFGSFQGEYDQNKQYIAGDTFIISEDTTISSVVVVAGYYGVPPEGTDSKGTWAGYVPANPTGNQVPQHPLPTSGTLYARLIVEYC